MGNHVQMIDGFQAIVECDFSRAIDQVLVELGLVSSRVEVLVIHHHNSTIFADSLTSYHFQKSRLLVYVGADYAGYF